MGQRVQICRAFAIIAVLMIHNNPSSDYVVFVRPIYNFAVAAFLFLSGYLTKLPIERTVMLKRLKRVLVPYVIWSVIYAVLYGNLKTFLYDLITFQCCGIYYYFAVYIQFVLFTPLIGKLLKSKFWGCGFAIMPLTLFIYYILGFYKYPMSLPWSGMACVAWLSYYYLGLCLCNKKVKLKNKTNFYVIVYVFSLLLQAFEGWAWNVSGNYDMATSQMKFSAAISSCLCCVLMSIYIEKNTFKWVEKSNLFYKILLVIGDDSFAIYLSHLLLMKVFNHSLYMVIDNIFPLNVLIVLLAEVTWIEIVKKILINNETLCRWLGLE